jgi:hypothetical protein
MNTCFGPSELEFHWEDPARSAPANLNQPPTYPVPVQAQTYSGTNGPIWRTHWIVAGTIPGSTIRLPELTNVIEQLLWTGKTLKAISRTTSPDFAALFLTKQRLSNPKNLKFETNYLADTKRIKSDLERNEWYQRSLGRRSGLGMLTYRRRGSMTGARVSRKTVRPCG